MPDCVLNYIIIMIIVIISHYTVDITAPIVDVFNGLYCCATVWLGMGGVNYVSCVYVHVFDARWSSSAKQGNSPEGLI